LHANDRLQHPYAQTIASESITNCFGFFFFECFCRTPNLFAQDRLMSSFFVFLDDLLNSALRHFEIPRNLSYAHMLAILTKNVPDLRLDEFHILDLMSRLR
jgi:hypothetical protein